MYCLEVQLASHDALNTGNNICHAVLTTAFSTGEYLHQWKNHIHVYVHTYTFTDNYLVLLLGLLATHGIAVCENQTENLGHVG